MLNCMRQNLSVVRLNMLNTDVFDLDPDNPGTCVQPSSIKLEYTPSGWLKV